MSWNYRIILHDLDPDPETHWLGLHEVHYGMPDDPASAGIGWTVNAVSFTCSVDAGKRGIIDSLEQALKTLRDPEWSEVIRESEYERHRRPAMPRK